jgi:ribosome-binding ATPase YchF (GTP1/OBG family)
MQPIKREQLAAMRLKGKHYIVKDGDVMHIRHSGSGW